MAINQNSALSLLLSSEGGLFATFGECSDNGDGNTSPVVPPILWSRTIYCVADACVCFVGVWVASQSPRIGYLAFGHCKALPVLLRSLRQQSPGLGPS